MNSSIRVSDVFQPSWKYTKSQIWILAGLYIGYIIISFTLGIFVSAANGSVGGGLLSALVSMVLWQIMLPQRKWTKKMMP